MAAFLDGLKWDAAGLVTVVVQVSDYMAHRRRLLCHALWSPMYVHRYDGFSNGQQRRMAV